MHQAFDPNAPKKPTNVSINSDLLIKARLLKINLSAALEGVLSDIVIQKHREEWLSENKEAIDTYNQLVEENGVFSDGSRTF